MTNTIYKQLQDAATELKNTQFATMMTESRANEYSIQTESIYFNYARNPIDNNVVNNLLELAKHHQLQEKIDAMFAGDIINKSEQRAVKHWLLRSPLNTDDHDSIAVHQVLDKMELLADKVANNSLLDKPVTDIVCVGIGGSELGTRLVYEALTMGKKQPIKAHFVANIDGMAVADAIANCNPYTTLFLIVSKTFTTFETTKNFSTLRQWFCSQEGLDEAQFWRQSCAITANTQGALDAGVPESQIFNFWDWVGGRYSLWSSVGLPIALTCGMDSFKELLAGACDMDKHFRTTEFSQNLPVMLGLLHIWYSDFLKLPTRCVVPYAQNLKSLPDHLQQLEMESLGKSVTEDGEFLNTTTCPVVWGSVGSNAQHAFFQLLHQGTQTVPIDFIAASKPCDGLPTEIAEAIQEHHTALLANFMAQSRSLMTGGKTRDDNHGFFKGNTPSNLLLLDKVSPYSLGQLIAAYEHKVLVQSVIWGINAFDQFGVELGKQMCNEILANNDSDIGFEVIKESYKH